MSAESEIQLAPVEFEPPVIPEFLASSRQQDRSFGGPAKARPGVVEYKDIEVRLGAQPLAWKLSKLKSSIGGDQPEELEVFDTFDVWLIAHAISAVARDGSRSPAALGYVVESLLPGVLNVRVLPDSEFLQTGGGKVEASAALKVNGEMQTPETLTSVAKSVYGLTGDAKLEASGSAEFMGRISFSCWTSRIVATGACDDRCEWRFHREDKPLFGTQLMFQTALVPKGIRTLPLRLTGYALLDKAWLPCFSRVSTKPRETQAVLAGSVSPVARPGQN